MAKLFFRYGTVGSAKTLNLLAVRQNYQYQGKRTLILIPKQSESPNLEFAFDQLASLNQVDGVLGADSRLDLFDCTDAHCILIDDGHFLTPELVEHLREFTIRRDIPVIVYGLKVDYRAQLWPAAERLFALADSVEEIKTTCSHCKRKAVFNFKTSIGPIQLAQLDREYLPMCPACYYEHQPRPSRSRSGASVSSSPVK